MMAQGETFKTHTSSLVWRVEDVFDLRRLNTFMAPEGIRIEENKIESTRFKWYAKIFEDYETVQSRKETELEFSIYSDDVNGFYDKFTFNCTIDVLTEKGSASISSSQFDIQLGSSRDLKQAFILPRVYQFMELRFNVILKEYDLTGCNVKAMSSIEYKQNIIEDLGNLLLGSDNSSCGDLTIEVEGRKVRAHKALIVMRSHILDAQLLEQMHKSNSNTICLDGVKFEAFNKFLKFIYTGITSSPASKDEEIDLAVLCQKYSIK